MPSEDRNGGDAPKSQRKEVDLATIKAAAKPTKPSFADREIADAISVAKANRIGQLASGAFPDTATGILKRAMAAIDPIGGTIERMGIFRGGAAEHVVRDALLGRDTISTAAALGTNRSLMESAGLATSRGPLADRTAREMVEAQRKMSDLILGRTTADQGLASAVRAAQGRIGQVDWTARHASGLAVASALDDTYRMLGIGDGRDEILGQVARVGSLARIATGLADRPDAMRRRAGEMLGEAHRRMDALSGLGTIGDELRAGYGDIFPSMRHPRRAEIDAVIAATRTVESLKPYPDWAVEARSRFEALTTPWVREDLPDASITAMARLGRLGRLVDLAPPDDAEVVETLRDRLGDYRDGDEPDRAVLDDAIARTGYQLDRGFDPVLTVLPTAVVAVMFAPFGLSDPVVDADPDHIENAVRMLMKRLEHALRRFVAERLRTLHGDGWFDTLPSKIRKAWGDGRQRDIDEGRKPDELIAYADIDHYRQIIEHPDRWGPLFQPVFNDQTAIRETLRRIAVVRNPGAHFRAVTVEDLIILRAESLHLAKWLGIRLGD